LRSGKATSDRPAATLKIVIDLSTLAQAPLAFEMQIQSEHVRNNFSSEQEVISEAFQNQRSMGVLISRFSRAVSQAACDAG
jgi:hypothetical protein